MRRNLWATLIIASLSILLIVSWGSQHLLIAQQSPAVVPASVVGGAFGGGNNNEAETPSVKIAPKPMTIAETKIWLKLQEKVAFSFPSNSTLEDAIKFVQKSTADKTDFPDGIPVYPDPQGLQDADKTLKSTIDIELKGIPLGTSLKLALAQLSLGYWVHPDGLLIITYEDSAAIPVDSGHLILEEVTALRKEIRSLREEFRASRGVEPVTHETQPPLRQTPAMQNPGGLR